MASPPCLVVNNNNNHDPIIRPRDVCIVGVARTPIGDFLGSLSSFSATQLGSLAIRCALERAHIDPQLVQEVFFGNVLLSANLGQAPARQAALGAGIPHSVVCTTINKVCSSGLKATTLAAQSIQVGANDIVVAGGIHVQVKVSGGRSKVPTVVDKDEALTKFDATKLRNLRPSFKVKGGSVTAGNASSISDGAAALVLVSGETASKLGLQVIAKIRGFSDADQAPELFTTAPALAIPKAISNAGLKASQIDYYEINESFSVVALANQKLLGIVDEQINVHGGAVSLGHPLGCSGARILVTLLGVLRQNNGRLGVAGICNGGGGASALVLELINNNNKRKIHDEILEEGLLPVPKHACLDNNHPLSRIQDTTCLDSVMSLSNHSKHHHNHHDVSSSSSSVNWSGATTPPHSNHHFDCPSPSFDQQPQLDCIDLMMSIPESYETNHQSQSHGHEDGDGDGDGDVMCCSNAAAAEETSSTNYVLSSGRWNIVDKQDTGQITEKLTIDKEFEQYFSMLML